MINFIIFLLGLIFGIITTILFIDYYFLIRCPQCKKKKPWQEIITFDPLDKREIKGQPCSQCAKDKEKQAAEKIEIF